MPELFDHQVVGRDRLVAERALLLGDEMRLGKTAQVIAAAEVLYKRGDVDRVLVIAPAQARAVWCDPDPAIGQVAKFAGVASRVTEFKTGKHRVWCNYDTTECLPLGRSLEYVVTNYELARRKERMPWLLERTGPRTALVLDESIAVANFSSIQSRACQRLARECGWVWLLNGTPAGDAPTALFGQFLVLDPSVLGKFISHFRAQYAVMNPFIKGARGNLVVVSKWVNLPQLGRKTAPFILRRTMDEVFDLPPKLDPVVREVKLTPKTWKIYRDMKTECLVWLSENKLATASMAGIKSMRLAQITSGYLGGVEEIDGTKIEGAEEIGREKLDAILEMIKLRLEDDPNWKGLIWTRFRPEAERLATFVGMISQPKRSSRLPFDLLVGGQKKMIRERALRLLNPDHSRPDRPACLIGTEATGKYAFNFAAAADVIYVSNDWSLLTRDQSEARVLGSRQTRSVLYTDVCAVGPKGERTIDHLVIAALRAKRSLAHMTVAEWTAALEAE